jgi:mannosyltransferase OCH1-like enzyme
MKNIRNLPNYSSVKEQNPANKKDFKYIPKKIFQTWETDKVTPGMYNAVHTWIDKNPDWECYFFDSASRRDFIKQHFPKEVLDAYDVIVPGAYKRHHLYTIRNIAINQLYRHQEQ